MLRVRNLTCGYGSLEVIKGISFSGRGATSTNSEQTGAINLAQTEPMAPVAPTIATFSPGSTVKDTSLKQHRPYLIPSNERY